MGERDKERKSEREWRERNQKRESRKGKVVKDVTKTCTEGDRGLYRPREELNGRSKEVPLGHLDDGARLAPDMLMMI